MSVGESLRPGARATVMGLGLFGGGVETARHLVRRGMRVTVTDLRSAELLRESIDALAGVDVTYVLGGHREQDFVDTDLVVANPAVAPSHPLLARARAAGVPIASEMGLFLEACPARVVLVTGTQGKSSTSHFVDHFLRAAGFRSRLGGNIGRSLLGALDVLGADDWVVLEISSYQLEALPPPDREGRHDFARRVEAVCCVNVLADHLERHGSVAGYEAAKRRILELARESSVVVLGGDDPRTSRWSVARGRPIFFTVADGEREPGAPEALARLEGGEFRLDGESLGRLADLALPGAFQRGNVLAALALARALGADPRRLAAALPTLTGLEHRLQDLGVFAGRRVWDNGVSTTPDSTIAALGSLEGPVVLLCGGQAKAGLGLEELVAASRGKVECLIGFGAAAPVLRDAFSAGGVEALAVESVEQAVAAAFGRGGSASILFSPACASFDRYRNFKDRALDFRAAVAAAATGPLTSPLTGPATGAGTGARPRPIDASGGHAQAPRPPLGAPAG